MRPLLSALILLGCLSSLTAEAQDPPPSSAPTGTVDPDTSQKDGEVEALRELVDSLQAEVRAAREEMAEVKGELAEHRQRDQTLEGITAMFSGASVILAVLAAGATILGVVVAIFGVLATIVTWRNRERFKTMVAKRISPTIREEMGLDALRSDLEVQAQSDLKAMKLEAAEDLEKLRASAAALQEQSSGALTHLEERQTNILAQSQQQVDKLQAELTARMKNTVAFVLGRMSRDEDNYVEYKRGDLLDRAIDFAEEAFQELKEVESDSRWKALNNLTFYKALRGKDFDGQDCLDQAEKLRDYLREHGQPHHFRSTYVRVLGQYAHLTQNPGATLEEAEKVLQQILSDGRVPKRTNDEARAYIPWLKSKKRQLRKS